MEHIKKAMQQAGVEKLTPEINVLVKSYQNKIRGIALMQKKGQTPKVANDEAILLKNLIIEKIFEIGEDLSQEKEQEEAEKEQQEKEQQEKEQQEKEQQEKEKAEKEEQEREERERAEAERQQAEQKKKTYWGFQL